MEFPRFQEKILITDYLIEKFNKKLKSELQFTNGNTLFEYNDNDVNKLCSNYFTKKNYYKKFSFSDMQYEENKFLSHTSHSEKRNNRILIDSHTIKFMINYMKWGRPLRHIKIKNYQIKFQLL